MSAAAALAREAFVERLRAEGGSRYHDTHPFHERMHAGTLRRDELQAWVANRYYYQTRIPIKDALILAKSEDPAFRRMWIHRLKDHDGEREGEGGLAQWLALARAVGLDPADVAACRPVLPGVRFACDGYVAARAREPARGGGGVVAHRVLRAGSDVEADRGLGEALPVGRRGRARVLQEPGHARARRFARGDRLRDRARDLAELQDACVAALVRKTEVLWHLLDCVQAATS